MPGLVFAFVVGLSLNVANTHSHNSAQASAALLSQFTNPVVTAADYSKLNQ